MGNIWLLKPRSNYYLFGRNKAKSISHRTQRVSAHVMISCFCGVFANKNMMSKRIAKIVANFTTTVLQQTRIHSEATITIASFSDERSKKICPREPKFLELHASSIVTQ